jgi:cytoskeleton protein RodZ
MTTIQSQPPESTTRGTDLAGLNQPDTDAVSTETPDVTFGSRLRAAREARGLDLGICAHTLKLPSRVLRQLERDQYDGSDSKVYLASYIAKYGRHLGINEGSIQVEMDRMRQVEAPLVATGGISHSRFLLDRYATAATYVVLTAVIVVPMIWFGVRGTLDRDLSHLAPLDAAPVAQLDATAESTPGAADPSQTLLPVVPPEVAPVQNQPLLASMAVFPDMERSDSFSLSNKPAPDATAADVGTGTHSLNLSLSANSWVEVISADGERLEYGLLPAGASKTYHSDKPLDIRIGNASGANVSIDGKLLGLDEFRHANVAHFRMQMQDGKASAANL